MIWVWRETDMIQLIFQDWQESCGEIDLLAWLLSEKAWMTDLIICLCRSDIHFAT